MTTYVIKLIPIISTRSDFTVDFWSCSKQVDVLHYIPSTCASHHQLSVIATSLDNTGIKINGFK